MNAPGRRRRPGPLVAPLLAAPLLLASGCEGRPRGGAYSALSVAASPSDGKASGEVAEIDLSRGAPEAPPLTLFGSTSGRSHVELSRALRRLEGARATRAVVVQLGAAGLGWARADEIASLLAGLRATERSVVCHADGLRNTTMWLAARACDRVWLSPGGSVETVGLAAQVLYLKRLLAGLHVQADFVQVGRFKGASEPFTREGPSEEARASLSGVLGDLRERWLSEIAKGRGRPALRELSEEGPFNANEALQHGFVDAIGTVEEARDEAKKRSSAARLRVAFGAGADTDGPPTGALGILRTLSSSRSSIGVPHVAVVRAVGAIVLDGSRSLAHQGPQIAERTLGRTLLRLTEDDAVKAVVLRIDSPGGSAIASDLLWLRLMKLRAKKPLVVSIGDMAASGGYYLASAGTRVFAQPTSVLGSIGVVVGKISFAEGLQKIGVNVESFVAAGTRSGAARALQGSPFAAWDDATRERMAVMTRSIYELFLARIAEGRDLSPERVAQAAEGRLFGGARGKELGLVDELGGFDAALRAAQQLAGLPGDAPVDLVGDAPGLMDLLGLGDADPAEATDLWSRPPPGPLGGALVELGALLPEVFPFVASHAPLLSGERALVAVPFAFLVR